MRVLTQNEKLFQEKYGISLEEAWIDLGDKDDEKYEKWLKSSGAGVVDRSMVPSDVLIVIICGMADYTALLQILEKTHSHVKKLIFEPDPLFLLYSCSKIDYSSLLIREDIDVIIPGINCAGMEDALHKYVDYRNIRHIYALEIPGYKEEREKLFDETVSMIKSVLKWKAAEYSTESEYGRIIFQNQLYALSHIYNGSTVKTFFDNVEDKGIPIILVGAGPSLEKNVNELKNVNKRALIVACSHATELLHKNGIDVDLVAQVDMEEGHNYCSYDFDNSYRMLFYTGAAKDIQAKYNGNGLYFGFDNVVFSDSIWQSEPRYLAGGGSVITMVFSLFVSAGFTRFILIGEDLAYSDEGVSHAGTLSDDIVEEELYTESIDGKRIRTRNDWIIIREYFEKLLEMHTNVNVTDSTEGGALIRGTVIKPLKQAILDMNGDGYDISSWFERLPKGGEQAQAEADKVLRTIERSCGDMQVLLGNSLNYNEYLIGMIMSNGVDSEEYRGVARNYDELYKEVMQGESGEYLREYCTDVLIRYMEKVSMINSDADLVAGLKVEAELFRQMRQAGAELRSIVKEYLNS